MDNCFNCKFFAPDIDYPKIGKCRRHPPVITIVQKPSFSEFPATTQSSWCGEHIKAVIVDNG